MYEKLNEKPWKEEGKGNNEWIIWIMLMLLQYIFIKKQGLFIK